LGSHAIRASCTIRYRLARHLENAGECTEGFRLGRARIAVIGG